MSRLVNAVSGRLSVRLPQRRSLEILDRISLIPHDVIAENMSLARLTATTSPVL